MRIDPLFVGSRRLARERNRNGWRLTGMRTIFVLASLVGLLALPACGNSGFGRECSGGVVSDNHCVSTQSAVHWTAAKAQAAALAFDYSPMVPGRLTKLRCRIVTRSTASEARTICRGLFASPGQADRPVVAAFNLSGIGAINPDCSVNWQTSPYCSGRNQAATSSDEGSSSDATVVEREMLKAAKAGAFQPPPPGHHYAAPVECRVDDPHGFHGEPIYLCKIAISKLPYGYLWEWGAWYQGSLHTHTTDPHSIRTITGAFDPPW